MKVMRNGVEMCMHLKKNLYGMVDAARNWFHTLEQWLLKDAPFKFKQMGSDQCCFWCQVGKEFMVLFLYVDDMIVLTTSVDLEVKLFDMLSRKDLSLKTKVCLITFLASQSRGTERTRGLHWT